MVFALFPLAFVGIAVLGFLVGSASAQHQVVDAITKFLPLGGSGRDGLTKAIAGTSHAKGWLSLVAIVTSIWSASGLFGTIRNALDSVWDVDRELPFLRGKFRDLTMTVVFGGLLLAALISTGFLQGARTAGSHMPVLGPLLHLVAPAFIVINLAVPFALTFLAFLFLYKRSPHARLTWSDVWVAAILAALFFTFGLRC
jgi:membrane protein